MANKVNFLMTGVTGYIGGSVLVRFLEHPDFASFNITVLVRSAEKAEKYKTLGVNAVVGSHGDLPLMEELASKADVVVAMADADNLEAMRATLRGLKKRHEATGSVPIFIHTSGTGVLHDRAAGMFATDTIYNDADADQIESLPPTQVHRKVDLEVVAADKEGYVKTYIVLPSTIYGLADTKLVKLGLQKPYSHQIPIHIRVALSRKQAGMVGEGKNIWPNVHINEVADLYVVLYNSIVSNPATGHGREGYYFGENGEYVLYDVCKKIGEVLVALGISKSAEPTTFTDDELKRYFNGSRYLGCNSRCRGVRSRSIGWKPVKTTADLLASIEPEVKFLMKANLPEVTKL